MASYRRSLLGASGFVGTTLSSQAPFDGNFTRANIGDLAGSHSDLLVCAAAPAQKWIANSDPANDLQNIRNLAAILEQASAEEAVLVSTVDVFGNPVEVDESTVPIPGDSNFYGQNRLWLERAFSKMFRNSTIVRLPGLVGPGLRKNAIFDLKNDNEVSKLNAAASFQFYPTSNLWSDLQIAIQSGLELVHISAEPITLNEVSLSLGVGGLHSDPPSAANYDFRSRYSAIWGKSGHYQYSARDSLEAIMSYFQS